MAAKFDPQRVLKKINEIETRFPVNEWNVNGLQIWPFLRTAIAYSQNRNPHTRNKKTAHARFYRRVFSKLKTGFSLVWQFMAVRRKLTSSRRLFFGSVTHRSKIDNVWVNKYFDMAVSDLEKSGESSLVLENTRQLRRKALFNSDLVYSIFSLYIITEIVKRGFTKKGCTPSLAKYDEFYTFLLENFEHPDILSRNFRKADVARRAVSLYHRKEFLKQQLRRSSVESAYFLCYYSATWYPMIAACNELGIRTVDIQHGGIGQGHYSYDNWSQVPVSGYSLMPRFFWTWDLNTAALINKWALKTSFHRAILNGNPWNSDALRVYTKVPQDTGYILLNMSEAALDRFIVDTIRFYGGKRKWVLRMHPRQVHNKSLLEKDVRDEGIHDHVE